MLIVEVSSVIVFPALVVRESLLLVLVVLKIGGTLSVVELSCVLFWVLLPVSVEGVIVLGVGDEVVDGDVDDDEADDDAEHCTLQTIKTMNIYVDRICIIKT